MEITRQKLGISKSNAYQRGLKFELDMREFKETPDVLREKLMRAMAKIEELSRELEKYKRIAEIPIVAGKGREISKILEVE